MIGFLHLWNFFVDYYIFLHLFQMFQCVTWRGRYEAEENRWRELSVDYAITKDFTTLHIIFGDMPKVESTLDLANPPPSELKDALDNYAIAVIYVDIENEIARCTSFGAEWMDLSQETGTTDGYCSAPVDTYWDALDTWESKKPVAEATPSPSSDFTAQTYVPSYRGTAFIITANVGHSWGSYNCCNDMYKLSNAGAEQRIHDNLNSLEPDLLLLQEMGNRHYWNTFASEATTGYTHHALSTSHTWGGTRVQVERLVKDAGVNYNYVCSGYTPGVFSGSDQYEPHYSAGMAFECVVWNTAKFYSPTQLPGASRGYTISDGAAGIELQQINVSRRIRVLSVHAVSPAEPDDNNRRLDNLNRFRTATLHSTIRTFWAGDFNMQPNKSGVDGNRFRYFVRWGSLNTNDTGGEDFIKPIRNENQTTAASAPFSTLNIDHLLVSTSVGGSWSCKVLYTNGDRLDFWSGSGGGTDHRAVACGTGFSY
jgi:endonuclease/exonuclease/phosphatase family metal-dependent hydrolase